jgi:hypothetical protein
MEHETDDHHDELGAPGLGSEAEEKLRSSVSRTRSRKLQLSKDVTPAQQQQHHTPGPVCSSRVLVAVALASIAAHDADVMLWLRSGSRGDVKRVKSLTKVGSRHSSSGYGIYSRWCSICSQSSCCSSHLQLQ